MVRTLAGIVVVSLAGVTLAELLRSVVRHPRRSPGVSPLADGVRPLGPGSPAPAIEGVSCDGSRVDGVVSGGRLTLLFLTSECRECEAAWRWAASDTAPMDRAASIVVTPGPETESTRRVANLADGGSPERQVRVVMSSGAWHAYGVTKAPWVVEIEAGAVVRSEPFPI